MVLGECRPKEGALCAIMFESVVAMMIEVLGGATVKALFKVLNSAAVDAYRICGGAVLTVITGAQSHLIKDVDVFIVPSDEGALVSALLEIPVTKWEVNTDVNEHSPGQVHDMKASFGGEYKLDIVFRKEVGPCHWVGMPSCTSGLVRVGDKLMAQIVGAKALMCREMYVKPKTDVARREKYEFKGYKIIDLAE